MIGVKQVQEKNQRIKEAEKNGIKIRIYHYWARLICEDCGRVYFWAQWKRCPFCGSPRSKHFTSSRHIIPPSENAIENFVNLLRRRFRDFPENIANNIKEEATNLEKRKCLNGITVAVVATPEITEATYSMCKHPDVFDRKTGSVIAFNRLTFNLKDKGYGHLLADS